VKEPLDSLLQLGRAERLQLVEDLWDSIAKEDAALPLADWKKKELQRRREKFLKDPSSGLSWEHVKMSARSLND
jgi:putative addiction module component (TIGR02574 family)